MFSISLLSSSNVETPACVPSKIQLPSLVSPVGSPKVHVFRRTYVCSQIVEKCMFIDAHMFALRQWMSEGIQLLVLLD